jgi:hypothetical protein
MPPEAQRSPPGISGQTQLICTPRTINTNDELQPTNNKDFAVLASNDAFWGVLLYTAMDTIYDHEYIRNCWVNKY